MKDLAEFIRALVRPVVTFALVGAAIWFVWQSMPALKDVPQWFQALVLLSVGYWFGSRTGKPTP